MSSATLIDQVVADLQAVTSFLATMKSASNYDSVREGQVMAMIQRVQSMKLRPQDGTALLSAWQQGPWTEAETRRFSEAVAGIVANQSNAAAGKRGMQHLTSFEHFLSCKDIEILGGESNNTLKLECLASRCSRLRLVCPSEPSVRAILASGVAHGANLGSHSESYAHSVTFKKILKQKAKQVPRQGTHLLHYPGSIDELPAELRNQAYDASDPPCPVDRLSPANVHKASTELVIRGSDKRVRGSMMGGSGGMMQLQQPFSNPMQFGMGMMPDPSSGLTIDGLDSWHAGHAADDATAAESRGDVAKSATFQAYWVAVAVGRQWSGFTAGICIGDRWGCNAGIDISNGSGCTGIDIGDCTACTAIGIDERSSCGGIGD